MFGTLTPTTVVDDVVVLDFGQRKLFSLKNQNNQRKVIIVGLAMSPALEPNIILIVFEKSRT